MKRLFFASVIVSLFVMGVSISWGETTVKGSKSNGSERVGGKQEAQKKGTKSTAAPATQDPCASVKNDPQQYTKCQDAANPVGLRKYERRGKKY
ncbi:hypothetical protein [Candidatus Methylomirabilis sp.]|uniref:hypothetical protein n=1 Tax=Candidatus Methylomirabilis sp. TaxID=2032687 RepID=UPI002A616639|nr:hypothetical protein [Candidatus Methylomirabilis sp.]